MQANGSRGEEERGGKKSKSKTKQKKSKTKSDR